MIIRLIRAGEKEECNAFHNRVYGHRRSPAQWKWEFIPTIFPSPAVPFAVAEDNGRIIGTQAFIPIRMIDKQGLYWTAKSEETLVDPAYRGQDLSVKMYQLLFEFAEQNDLACVWGFTTATKALQRSGFVVPAVTTQLFFPFSTRSIPILFEHEALTPQGKRSTGKVKRLAGRAGCAAAEIVSSLRFAARGVGRRADAQSRGWEIRTLDAAPVDGGSLCERFIKQWGGTTIYRDRDYLHWRIFQNPWIRSIVRGVFVSGQLHGWVAFGMGDDGMGYIVDLMVAGDGSAADSTAHLIRILLAEAVTGTRDMGAVGIRGWRVNDHPFDRMITRAARSMGFYHIRRGGPVVVHPTISGRQRRTFARFDDWYVSRIYTEGVLG